MKHIFTMLCAASLVSGLTAATREEAALPADFNDGMLLLNEGWFGHESASLNYLSADGTFSNTVFQTLNPGHTLGNTGCYGEIFGNRLLVVSKQSYGETGGIVTSMNASSLIFNNSLSTIPGLSNQGRAICSVSEDKAYLTTSKGIYIFNPTTFELSETELPNTTGKQGGDMIRYGKYVFAAVNTVGVLAIDVDTDEVTLLDIKTPYGFVVTADGTLYAATGDTSAEFVAIDPATLELTPVDIEGSHTMQNPFSTWRPAAIVADTSANKVYYGTGSWSVKTVVSYDFDTQEFETFFTAPGTADGLTDNRELYGKGINIDPATGTIILTLTESGFGTHYMYNWLYYINPATGETEKVLPLEEAYWFPEMCIFPNFSAPEIKDATFSLDPGQTSEINLGEYITLAVGNPHLTVFTAESSDPETVKAETDYLGNLTLTAVASGSTTVKVTASYNGRATTRELAVTVGTPTGIDTVSAIPAGVDVYTLTGVRVLRNADTNQIQSLTPGIYIAGGKKFVVL